MASAAPAPSSDAAIPPFRRVLAGVVLAMANLMVVLDLTIANVSVPHIAGDLGISLDQGAWIITSYAVAEAICVPLTGWLSDRFGAVRVFLTALCGFGLFSLLCGMSVTLGMLVAFRIGQGMCGAPLMPISQALMLRVFPPHQRGAAMGGWAITIMVGPALGPIMGGAISDAWSWHWIFLINIPLAIVCVASAYVLLRPFETEKRRLPIDKVGLGLLIFWIGCLQIMLDIGRDHDWFGDPLIVALAIMAAIGCVVFVIWELTEEHPIVDLRIFRNRGFAAGVVALSLSYGGYFSGLVIIPQWLQSSMGYTASMAGLVTAFSAMTAMTTTPLAGRLLGKVDSRVLVSSALVWCGLMILLRTGWNSSVGFWDLAMPQILMGFGLAFFMVPLTSLTLNVVRPDQVPAAAGLQNFLRTIALALSTSLSLTAMGNGERVAQSEMVSVLAPDATASVLAGIGFGPDQIRLYIGRIVSQEATMAAVIHVFWYSSLICLLAAAVVWLSPKPPKMGAPISGH